MATETKATPEDSFKETLEDVRDVIINLLDIAPSTNDLFEQVSLALENELHLKLLLAHVTKKPKK